MLIDAQGLICVDARAVDLRAVRAHIEHHRAVNSEAGIVVVAHEHAPTGTLVAVVDQIHLGGIYDITFTTAE